MSRTDRAWWYRLAHTAAFIVAVAMLPTYPDISLALMGSGLILFAVAIALDR